MEHLILWLIQAILKAVTQKNKPEARANTTPRPLTPTATSTDPWADYRRKQAAIEREMIAKSPTATKR